MEYIVIGGTIYGEIRTENGTTTTLHYLFDENGTRIGFVHNRTNIYYYRFNLQGDVTGIYDDDGDLIVEYTYDAWGKLEDMSGNTLIGLLNPIRYRGYYYDIETGLYYLQSRYYDPETGRFINADVYASTGQGVLGHNMFAYCLNNPVNFADPTGCACICLTRRVGPRHVCESVLEAQKAAENDKQMRDVTDEVNNALIPAATKAYVYNALTETSIAKNLLGDLIIYPTFGLLVFHKSAWDIKRERSWEFTIGTEFPGYNAPVIYDNSVVTPAYLGNYTYGFLGYSFGIPLVTLYIGSYVAAGCPTRGEPYAHEIGEDWAAISAGYCSAKNYFEK